MSADQARKGTAWKSYNLRWLKLLRKALPKLSHSYWFEGISGRGDYACVRLSTSDAVGPGEITFDIDAEYQKWLDANKQRRIAKRAQQNGENGDVA